MEITCNRCNSPAIITTGSMFNTEMICIPCNNKEKQHPDYERAVATELEEVKKGNYNYEGIGKPANL